MATDNWDAFIAAFKKNLTNAEHDIGKQYTNGIEGNSCLEFNESAISSEIVSIENEIYISFIKVNNLKKCIEEQEKDFHFTSSLNDVIICPTCGVRHDNNMEYRLEILKNIQNMSDLIHSYRDEINVLEGKLKELHKQKSSLDLQYASKKKELINREEAIVFLKNLQLEGKMEIVNNSVAKQEKGSKELDESEFTRLKLKKRLEYLASKDRRKTISDDLKTYCLKVFETSNVPKTKVSLREFIQSVETTGSDLPRIVLSYQTALYLFNLNRRESPFNIFILDIPNQQGQDGKNLGNIDAVLELLLNDDGQVILGTEQQTDVDNKARKYYELPNIRRCLEKVQFDEHFTFINELQKIANSEIRKNFESNN